MPRTGIPSAVVHGCAKSVRHENGVEAVMLGGQGSDEPARVRLSAAAKALGFSRLASCFCVFDESLVDLHVERERGCRLMGVIGAKMAEPVRRQASLTPKLGGLGLRRTVDDSRSMRAGPKRRALRRRSGGQSRKGCPPITPISRQPRSRSTYKCMRRSSEKLKKLASLAKLNAFAAALSLTLAGSSQPCPPSMTASTPFSCRRLFAQPCTTTRDPRPRQGDRLSHVQADHQHP